MDEVSKLPARDTSSIRLSKTNLSSKLNEHVTMMRIQRDRPQLRAALSVVRQGQKIPGQIVPVTPNPLQGRSGEGEAAATHRRNRVLWFTAEAKAAVAQDGMALQFASERLRADHGVVKARCTAPFFEFASFL